MDPEVSTDFIKYIKKLLAPDVRMPLLPHREDSLLLLEQQSR